MRRDDNRLADIRRAAEDAIRFAAGRVRSDLDDDPVLAAALVFQMIMIGEAAAAVSADTRRRLPGVPWSSMVGMRNLVVHAYWQIDHDVLWTTLQEDLPSLLAGLPAGLPAGEKAT